MQPYLFPYIGYFQLIKVVDKFILFDDVNYIKKGWINRNRILVNKEEFMFTIPVKAMSQNKHINELFLVEEDKWKKKLVKTLEESYKNAPNFESAFSLLNQIIYLKEQNLSKYILNSLEQLKEYLGITTEIVPSSSIYGNGELKAQDRILDICRKESADQYFNAIGGMELYSKEEFAKEGIVLKFLRPSKIEYRQFDSNFQPLLSIIDSMMFNSQDELSVLLNQFEIL